MAGDNEMMEAWDALAAMTMITLTVLLPVIFVEKIPGASQWHLRGGQLCQALCLTAVITVIPIMATGILRLP